MHNSSSVILFDIDGVLIDTRASYAAAIVWSAQRQVARAHAGLALGSDAFSSWRLRGIKEAGGFNNDWLASAALALLGPLPEARARGVLAALRAEGGGWATLCGMLGSSEPTPSVSPMTELVRDFQWAYLGEDLFHRLHPNECHPSEASPGFIGRETLLVGDAALHDLAQQATLGIVTGRPRAEAAWALANHGIARYFDVVVTHDCVEEGRSAGGAGKPSPWPLLEAMRRLRAREGRDFSLVCYVGDLPDDITAGRAAGARAWGVVSENSSLEALNNAGAERVFGTAREALGALRELLHSDQIA